MTAPVTNKKHWAIRLFEEKEADFNRRHPGPATRVDFDDAGQLRRCKVTGNPCGTDTWGNGAECPCAACQNWLSAASKPSGNR